MHDRAPVTLLFVVLTHLSEVAKVSFKQSRPNVQVASATKAVTLRMTVMARTASKMMA